MVPFGDADLAGDVVHGQVGDVVEHQRLALGLGQLLERRHQRDVGLARRRASRSPGSGPGRPGAGRARYAASG